MTRRFLLRLLGAWTPAAAWGSRQPAPPTDHTVHYRAKATILMLSVPMFSRDNVGGGFLRVAERDEAGGRRIELEFGAGSLPERAAGLTRFGAFEESILEADGSLATASYFGFMSASDEKNLDQARSALSRKPGNALTAIRGHIDTGRVWNRLVHLRDLPLTPWSEHRVLQAHVRRRFEESPGVETEIGVTEGQPLTFLYAVRCAMRSESKAGNRSFVHNGELLQLRTRKTADPGHGAGFAARGLSQTAQVELLNGQIHHVSGRMLSSFQLWFEPGSTGPVPLRFDLRPRSFLRLSFERTPAA